jgi:hypothetical protein
LLSRGNTWRKGGREGGREGRGGCQIFFIARLAFVFRKRLALIRHSIVEMKKKRNE